MCAYPYSRPRGFGYPPPLMSDQGSYHGPQAPGAYPYGGQGRGYGRGNPSALGDLVDSAKKRAWMFKSKVSEGLKQGVDVLRNCLMNSMTANPVYAINSALQNSNMPHLHLGFECDFLCTMGNYPIFTGVLNLTDHFLVRGLGATKESCKVDTYRKAQKLIMGCTTDQVLQQEDIGEQALCQEVYHMFSRSPQAFYDMVQAQDAPGCQEGGGYWEAPPQAPMGMKRPYNGPFPPPSSGSVPMSGTHPPGWMEPVPEPWGRNTLIHTTKITLVMKHTDKLEDKLLKLKQLLKEEGITKLYLVPKIDLYAQKAAIDILNVVRFTEPAHRGNCPVYVEVYFDGVLLGLGEPALEVCRAMESAYENLANTMCRLPDFIEIVQKGRRWTQFSKRDHDICDILPKKPGQDNGSLLTTNLSNMTQMMGSGPDFTNTMDRLVITEHEVDKDEHLFKMLELSCTRNHVFLECEIARLPHEKFRCSISANGTHLGDAIANSKPHCKKKCSEKIMEGLLKTNDHIYVLKEHIGKTITKAWLVEEATRMYQAGEPPAKYEIPQPSQERFEQAISGSLKPDAEQTLGDKLDLEPENIALRPLLPYMAAVVYKLLDEYYLRISLEDILVNTKDMARSQYVMVNFCAIQMGFRVVSTRHMKRGAENTSLLRRPVTAPDMVWICQVNGGNSGRFKLKRLAYPKTDEELAKLKAKHFAYHQSLIEARAVAVPKEKETKQVTPQMQAGSGNQFQGFQQQGTQSANNWQQSNSWGQQSNNGWQQPVGN